MIILHTKEQRAKFIQDLCDAQLPLEVSFQPYKRKRSLSFNAYYWGCVVTPMAEHCGESEGKTHENLCGDYWGWVTKEFNGRKYEVPRRSTTENEQGKRDVLNWEQMSNFVEHAKMVGANMGVRFPDYDAQLSSGDYDMREAV